MRRDLEDRYLPRKDLNQEARGIVEEISQNVLPIFEDCLNPEHRKRLRSELEEVSGRHAWKLGGPNKQDWEREAAIGEESKPIREKAWKPIDRRIDPGAGAP